MTELNKNTFYQIVIIFLFGVLMLAGFSCKSPHISTLEKKTDTIFTNQSGKGWPLEIIFNKGEKHNHPLMAVWVTDTNGRFIESLFVAQSIAKGVFEHGDKSSGKWMPGSIRRPAALPVWSYSRNVREQDGLYIPTEKTALPDAISGATPPGNFVLFANTSSLEPAIFDIYFEINQSWDWNEYWTNNKFPDDADYMTSCQPSLIYTARFNAHDPEEKKVLNLIGHGHYSGDNGTIYTDLNTITTAGKIVQIVNIQRANP